MGLWDNFGIGALGSLVEGGINAGFKELDRARNFHWNEKAADAADQRQRKQFQDLYSYSAQMRQMREAGLSPSLMYAGGAGGQGGASASQGLGAGGVQAGYARLDPMSKSQIDLAESQAQLNEAEAKGLEIENKNKQGAIDADIALKLSQAGLNKAAEAYKNIQTEREVIQLIIDEQTTDAEVKQRNSAAEKTYWESWIMFYESISAQQKSNMDVQLYETRVKQEIANYKETLQNIKVGESIVRLNDATIEKMAFEVAIAFYNANTNRMSYEAQKRFFEDTIKNQIKKMEQDKTIAEEQIKAMKQGQWLKFATDIFGSVTYMASTIASAGIRAAAEVIPF